MRNHNKAVPRQVLLVGFWMVLLSASRLLLQVSMKFPPNFTSDESVIRAMAGNDSESKSDDKASYSSRSRLSRTATLEANDTSTPAEFNSCGCPATCDEKALAQRFRLTESCMDRIHYLMTRYGDSELDACSAAVRHEACGSECDPRQCMMSSTGAANRPSSLHVSRTFPVQTSTALNKTTVIQKQATRVTQSTRKDDGDTTTLVQSESSNETKNSTTLSFPIFVASLPKSATASIAGYLSCGGIKTGHYRVHPRRPRPVLGNCIERNIARGNSVFASCGNYQAYSDTAYATFDEPYRCFIPSIQALDAMYRDNPNFTLILGVRDTAKWYESFSSWYDGGLMNAWRHCNAPGFPGVNATRADFMQLYEWHTQHIRNFAASHPYVKYIEVQLESPETGDLLEHELGIPSTCWQHMHKSRKQKKPSATKTGQGRDAAVKSPTGVIVLSAGRSGTSLLTGVMSLASGYATGDKDELIPPRAANAKGYFERKDVVNQNMQLLKFAKSSHMDANSIHNYIPTQNMSLFSRKGKRALAFLNDSKTTIPWIVKDPRLSVTLKEWLPFLNTKPAILITYRHPLEVARSWQRRDKMALSLGLDVWSATNEALLRNSAGLCRVVTSNNAILQDPVKEVNRIVEELTNKCRVPPPPNSAPLASVVNSFVDVNMQTDSLVNLPKCNETQNLDVHSQQKTKERYNIALEKAMKLYCDMQSGIAFEMDSTKQDS